MEATRRRVPRSLAAAAVAFGLLGGGYGLADAATGTSTAKKTTRARGAAGPRPRDTRARVGAAALAKVSGGTIVRAETDADGNAMYEAHMTDASGNPVTV